MKSRLDINKKLLNRIISVAYGDANLIERIKIYFLAAGNNEVKRLLNEYKTTAAAVRKLNKENCPDEVLEKVKNNTGIKENKLLLPLAEIINSIIYRPALTTVAVLIIAAFISLFVLFNNSNRNQYSEKQILLAEKQVKQSLVLVSKVFNRTADKLKNDIIREQVAKPVHEGVSTINELFNGG